VVEETDHNSDEEDDAAAALRLKAPSAEAIQRFADEGKFGSPELVCHIAVWNTVSPIAVEG